MNNDIPINNTTYANELYHPGLIPYDSRAEEIRFNKILKLIGRNKKILDIGCYDGSLGKLLINNNNEVYGIEINKESAKLAKKRGLRVKVQDATETLGFKNDFFDIVVAGEIIEHILDTDFFINEIKRVLKPGGQLVLTTPNMASFGRRILLLLGKNPHMEASLGFPPEARAGHIRFFTKGLLIRYLQHKKFKVLKFTSDVVNFNRSGSLMSSFLANLFPTLGKTLIFLAKNQKQK